MSFRSFFVKSILIPFFVITTLVSIGIGVLGLIFAPDVELDYSSLFLPICYGIATSLPSIATYSKKELSVKSMLIREIIQLFLIEAMVLGVNWWGGTITSLSVAVSLFFTVMIIFFTVMAVSYLNDKRTADELNDALRKLNGNS